MFNRVVSIFVMAVVLGMETYADVVPQALGSIRVNTPMYTAEGVDNIVSNVVAGIEKDNITDGTNTIDAAGGVYERRGVGDDWTKVSGKYHTDTPIWITKEDKEKAVEETGWYGYGLDVGYQFLSADFYAMEITGVVEGREYDSEVGGMVFHVSTNTWRRTHTEVQFIGKLALTNDIQKVFQLSTNAANNLITAATNGCLQTEQDPIFSGWTNRMDVAAGRGAQANATGATALGYGAYVNNKYGIAVGNGKALGDYGIALGHSATASGEYDTALGQRITMNGPYGAAVGAYSSVIGSYGSALGPYSYAGFSATALGNNSYAPSKSFGTTYDPEHFYFTSSNDTTAASKRGVTKKSLQAYLDERVATNAISKVATSGAYTDLTGKPTSLSEFGNDMGFVTSSSTVFLPTTGGTLTGDLKVGDTGHIGHVLVQDSNGQTMVRINGEQTTGATYGGEIEIGGQGTGGGGRLVVKNGAYGGGEVDILGAKGGGQATFKMSCATGENTGGVVIRSGSNSWDDGEGNAPSITLGDNTADPENPLQAEITIGDVKVRESLAAKADKTALDAKQDKLTKDSAPTVGALLLMGDRPSNGVSLGVTPDGAYGALAVKGADNRTSVLTPDGSPVLTQTLGDARYATAEALASLTPESIKKTVDGAKWALSADLVSTKTTTAAGEASCTLTTQFGTASLSKIQDRLFSGVLDGIGNVAVWWDGSAWNWGTHPVPSDPTSMQSVSTDPSSGANATSLSFSDGSKATIALGAGTEVVETSHLATAEAVAAAYVPVTRTVNGKPLSADMVLTAADVGAVGSETDPLFSAWKDATNVLIGAGASTIAPVSPFVNNSVAIGSEAKTVPFYGSDGKYKEAEAVAIGHGAEAHGYGVAIGKGSVSSGNDVVLGSESTTGLIVFADPNSFVFRTPEEGTYVSKPLQSFLDKYWKKTDWLVGVPRVEIVSDGLVKCPDYMGTDGVSVCFSADGNDIDDTTSRLYPDGSKVMTETMTNEKLNDYATKSEVDAKADKTNVYTKAEADAKVASDVATALDPYLKKSGGTVTGNLTLGVGSGGGSPTLEVSGVSSAGIRLNAEYGGKITVGHGSNGGGQIVLEDSSVTGGAEADVTIGTVKVRATLSAKADKSTTLAGYGITDAVPLVEDVTSNKTAVTIGSRKGIVGPYSLANGNNVTASGQGSHAEGLETVADGLYSHADGMFTEALGPGSYALGYMAKALPNDRHAFVWNGQGGSAEPYLSHGEGTFNINTFYGLDGFYIGEQKLLEALSTAITSNGEGESSMVVVHTNTPSLRTAVEKVAVEAVLKPSDPLCGWSLPEYVSALSKYVWDAKEQCCYRREATNSYIILTAVTNIDLTAVGNIAALKAYEDSIAIRKPPEVSVCYTIGYEQENNKFRTDGTDFMLEGEYLEGASVTVSYEVSGATTTETIQPSFINASSESIRIASQALTNARSATLGSTITFTIQTAYGRTTASATVANSSE